MHVGFIKSLLWLCHQEKVVPCPTRLCDTSIPENQKNLFSHNGMTTLQNIKIYFFLQQQFSPAK